MNIVRHRRWFFLVSLLLVLPAIFSLIVPPTLRAGIDFTGGTALTIEFDADVATEPVRDALLSLGHAQSIVQSLSGNSYFIRLGELEPPVTDSQGNVITPGGRQRLEEALGALAAVEVLSFDAISPAVGAETVRNAIIAVFVAAVAILLYITWAFRHVPSPFRYGVCAIIALLHDVVIVLGVFSILGKVVDLEVNAMFITGVLAIIGYSINDTIVVFDRIRENVARYLGHPLEEVVGLSIRETIGRSLNTSLTTLVVVIALLVFGGPTIQTLLLALLVGAIVGTYSSIFIASLLLVAWETGQLGGLLHRLRLAPRRT